MLDDVKSTGKLYFLFVVLSYSFERQQQYNSNIVIAQDEALSTHVGIASHSKARPWPETT